MSAGVDKTSGPGTSDLGGHPRSGSWAGIPGVRAGGGNIPGVRAGVGHPQSAAY